MVAAANTKIPKEEEEEEEEEEKGWMPKRPPLLRVCLYFLCLRDSLTDYPCNDEGILKLTNTTPSSSLFSSCLRTKHFDTSDDHFQIEYTYGG
ncbi:hypothetical protein M0804_012297 [Polistes exclamans]|nr:hypothetical protein M0804_012297 [Polistes exclamans]